MWRGFEMMDARVLKVSRLERERPCSRVDRVRAFAGTQRARSGASLGVFCGGGGGCLGHLGGGDFYSWREQECPGGPSSVCPRLSSPLVLSKRRGPPPSCPFGWGRGVGGLGGDTEFFPRVSDASLGFCSCVHNSGRLAFLCNLEQRRGRKRTGLWGGSIGAETGYRVTKKWD